MGALQVLAFVASALLVLENGCWQVDGAAYSYTTRHQSSSSNRATARAAATQPKAVVAPGTRNRAELAVTDYRRYLPVEDTPEVKKAREQFFTLYKKQAILAAEAPDTDLDGRRTSTGVGAYRAGVNDVDCYDYEEDSEEGDEEDDDDDDEEEDEDSLEDGEDSSDEEDSSSSSEEDEYGDSSSSEEDSSEEGFDSSEEDLYGEDSSSSSSSSEEDEGTGYHPLNTNALSAPRPVTDTPEVKQAKRNFFELYKAQAELSFNAPDDK